MFGIRFVSSLTLVGLLCHCSAQPQAASAKSPSSVVEADGAAEGSGTGEVDQDAESPPSTGVDLTITRIFWSPAHPKAGQPLTFSAAVKNRGTVATDEGTVIGVAFQINGMTVSWSDTNKSALGPGETRKLTANFGPGDSATWSAIAGEHQLGAWVDDVKRLPDTNRNNDSTETPLLVK